MAWLHLGGHSSLDDRPTFILDRICSGRRAHTIWIADAHRGDGKRFVLRVDDKLTAFVELESAARARRELA